MFDKLLFNNQVLANKKKIQRAKVNVINKLVHKLRKIKEGYKTAIESAKIQRKIERCEGILTCLKKLKSMDVIRKSLLNEKNPVSVITNGAASVEEVALAQLFRNKLIQEITKHFKELFNFNDIKNPDWKNELIRMSERKKRTKKKNTEPTNIKRKLSSSNKHELKSMEIDINNLNSSADAWESAKSAKNETFLENNILAENSVKEIRFRKKKYSSLTADPFFVTQCGANYMSSVLPNNDVCEEPAQNKINLAPEKSRIKNGTINRMSKKSNNLQTQRNQNKLAKTRSFGNKNKTQLSNSKSKDSEIQKYGKKQIPNVLEHAPLHPSWEAKQKMKPIIADFKGTKITFDDYVE